MTAAELREESAKVLAPAREVGCVESEFWLEVVCSSHGAVLKLFWWWHCVMLLVMIAGCKYHATNMQLLTKIYI